MPIYMDLHMVPGASLLDVAEAHQLDLAHEADFGCKCMTYWVDDVRENVFCLIQAPNKEAVIAMHDKSHGLVPNRIIEVESSLVESFLGRIHDPKDAVITEAGIKVISDTPFRILMLTKTLDPLLLQYNLGIEKTAEVITKQNLLIRAQLRLFGGREVEHALTDFIATFSSASNAVNCALAILNDISSAGDRETGFKIAIHAGDPVEKSRELFGDTLRMARNICSVGGNLQVAITHAVKELVAKDFFQKMQGSVLLLKIQDENFLNCLYEQLEANWQAADFNLEDYGRALAMSKSQLYRKTISLTGLAPNLLLKDFRLEKAKELMKKGNYSVSQITFEAGFSSPSYFTKCFKKKYGLLPMAYLALTH